MPLQTKNAYLAATRQAPVKLTGPMKLVNFINEKLMGDTPLTFKELRIIGILIPIIFVASLLGTAAILLL